MDFGEALVLFKTGQLMRRSFWPRHHVARLEPDAWFSKCEDDGYFDHWSLSHADIIAEDWEPVEICA